MIEVSYFALTTLTTIGFGDLHPISDSEKVLMVLGFIGGVGVFTIMIGNFNDSIQRMIDLSKDYEESDKLS